MPALTTAERRSESADHGVPFTVGEGYENFFTERNTTMTTTIEPITTSVPTRPLDRVLELERLLDEDEMFKKQFASDPSGAVVARSLDVELPVEAGPATLSELLRAVPAASASSSIETVRTLLDDSAPRQPAAFWGANTNGAANAEVVTNVGGYHEVAAAEMAVAVVVATLPWVLTGTPSEPSNSTPHALRLQFDESVDPGLISGLQEGFDLSPARLRALLRRGVLEGETERSEFTEDGYEHKVVEFEADGTRLRVESKVGIDDIIVLDAEAVAA